MDELTCDILLIAFSREQEKALKAAAMARTGRRAVKIEHGNTFELTDLGTIGFSRTTLLSITSDHPYLSLDPRDMLRMNHPNNGILVLSHQKHGSPNFEQLGMELDSAMRRDHLSPGRFKNASRFFRHFLKATWDQLIMLKGGIESKIVQTPQVGIELEAKISMFPIITYKTVAHDAKSKAEIAAELVEYTMDTLSRFKPAPALNKQGLPMDRCSVAGYYPIGQLHLKNLSTCREVYFLGENGDGKTLILQAILFALKKSHIEDLKNAEVGKALDILEASNGQFAAQDVSDGAQPNYYSQFEGQPTDLAYGPVFAYGVHRGRSSADTWDRHGFMTLFDNHATLRDPISWLQKVYTRELEFKQDLVESAPAVTVETAIKMLRQVLDEGLEITVRADEVTFIERGSRLSLEQLSEGYRSVLIWLLDLVAHFAEMQAGTAIEHFRGIVLVDEIGLHLHPKWEMKLVGKLREWFPLVQFFFTTHSPITVMGASEDAVFYKVYKEEGMTQISEPFQAKDMKGMMANNLITSPLFDLPSARMRALPADATPDTNHSDLYRRIDREVNRRVKDLRKEGRTFIPPDEIDKMVAEALDESGL